MALVCRRRCSGPFVGVQLRVIGGSREREKWRKVAWCPWSVVELLVSSLMLVNLQDIVLFYTCSALGCCGIIFADHKISLQVREKQIEIDESVVLLGS